METMRAVAEYLTDLADAISGLIVGLSGLTDAAVRMPPGAWGSRSAYTADW
jgi:hypothetical protein